MYQQISLISNQPIGTEYDGIEYIQKVESFVSVWKIALVEGPIFVSGNSLRPHYNLKLNNFLKLL